MKVGKDRFVIPRPKQPAAQTVTAAATTTAPRAAAPNDIDKDLFPEDVNSIFSPLSLPRAGPMGALIFRAVEGTATLARSLHLEERARARRGAGATEENQEPLWNGYIRNGRPFGPVALRITEGKIPDDVHGTLFRNGPAMVERDRRIAHLFDGNGAILGVHISGGQAQASYRFVQTHHFKKEEKRGRFLFMNFQLKPTGVLP